MRKVRGRRSRLALGAALALLGLLAMACANGASKEDVDLVAAEVEKLKAQVSAAQTALAPKTQNWQVEIFHLDSFARPAGIKAGLPENERVVTTYIWRPNGLYALKGDTVVLKVINNAGTKVHSFELAGYGINTGEMMPKSEKTVTFVADKVGVFKFQCGVSPDPTTDPQRCSVDHAYQYGFLTVLDR